MTHGRNSSAARHYPIRFVDLTLSTGELIKARFRRLPVPTAFRATVRRINFLGDVQKMNLLKMRRKAQAGEVAKAVQIYQAVHAEAAKVATLNRRLGLSACG